MSFQTFKLIFPERIVFSEQLILAFCRFLACIPISWRIFRGQGGGLVGLELDRIRAGFRCFVNQASGYIHVAFMVDPRLRDYKRRLDAQRRCADIENLRDFHFFTSLFRPSFSATARAPSSANCAGSMPFAASGDKSSTGLLARSGLGLTS